MKTWNVINCDRFDQIRGHAPCHFDSRTDAIRAGAMQYLNQHCQVLIPPPGRTPPSDSHNQCWCNLNAKRAEFKCIQGRSKSKFNSWKDQNIQNCNFTLPVFYGSFSLSHKGKNIDWGCWGEYLDWWGRKWREAREECIMRSFITCMLHRILLGR